MSTPIAIGHHQELSAQVSQMLQDGAQSGDWTAFIAALDGGLPANLESQGDVPLFEHVLFALEAQAQANQQSETEQAPLAVLEALLRNGLDPRACYEGRATHVTIAANYGQWDWARHLMSQGFAVEVPGQSVLVAITAGRLQRALARGMAELASSELLAAPPSPSAPSPSPAPASLGANVHMFPSWKAATGRPSPPEPAPEGQVLGAPISLVRPANTAVLSDVVADLVTGGADLQVRVPMDNLLGTHETQSVFPPLMHAIFHLDETMAQALVHAGASVTHRPDGLPYRPLEMAISRGSSSLVKRLIALGAPVGPDPSHEGAAQRLAHPLVLCARLGLDHLVELVAGAMSPQDITQYGTIAMHVAAAEGNVPSMRAIRLLGIPYDVPTHPNGFRPIHQAAFAGQQASLEFLLRRGQQWDSRSSSGLTAQDVLSSHHPHLLPHFNLAPASNVRSLMGRKPSR
jgi:hypothetical protein